MLLSKIISLSEGSVEKNADRFYPFVERKKRSLHAAHGRGKFYCLPEEPRAGDLPFYESLLCCTCGEKKKLKLPKGSLWGFPI